MRRLLLTILFFAGLLPVWGQTNQYAARGVVQAVAADHRQVTIRHEAIPGYMMAMTMDFPVRDTKELAGLTPGEQVTFTLVVTGNEDWVQNLRPTGQMAAVSAPAATTFVSADELQPGDLMPPTEFTDETGRKVHLADFRGSAVAFTFFFTRCPLPDYCPRMNRNFAEARKRLLADTNGPTNWQFLSVSFDAEFDRPETLRLYAHFYRGDDTNRWLFASAGQSQLRLVAPQLDFHYWTENGTFSHNLRTVVLDTQGRIARQFDGNDWTPEQLADALRQAAH